METKIYLTIMVVHFLAYFALQTDWQAKNKSSNDGALFFHCLTYSLVWLMMSFIILGSFWEALGFFAITLIAHTFTDYHTSRLAKGFFDRKDFHNGFKIVGFDQVLHYLQLYFTFQIFL